MANKHNTKFLFKMLSGSLVRRRSRMAVALLGIAIGATVLLGMVTLCYDIPRQMSKEFRSYGANMVLVSTGHAPLNLADVAKAKDLLPTADVLGMTPFRYIPVRNNLLPYTAVGTDFAQVKNTSPYWRIEGRWPENDHEVLAGADIAEYALFTPGKAITIDGRNSAQARFEQDVVITGIVHTGGVEDGFLFMDLAAMEAMTGEAKLADVVEVSLSADEERLKDLAAAIHSAVPGLEAKLVKRVTHSEAAVLGKLTMLVYLVTVVVLALTMICVATTMMAVVLERRREIGLKKALGATNQHIVNEFLAEGFVLGFVGGVIGAACGLVFAQVICARVFERSITIELYLLPVTVAVAVAVTVAACLLPARRAMDIEPALVLKGE